MKKDIQILKHLLESEEEQNIKKIAEAINTDYKNTYTIIKRLEKEKIIELIKFGHTNRVIITKSPNSMIFLAELSRREEALNSKNIKLTLEYFLKNLKTKLFVMLLFGSYAKKTQKKDSDIDLMFIIPDESLEKEINSISSIIPLNLHLNIFTEKEFIDMKNSKTATVGAEAIKNNIILHGAEAYYEMIK